MGIFVQKVLHIFFSHFLPNLGRQCLGGPREKTPGPHQIPSPSPFQPNTSPNNFLSFFFHAPYFTYNQTHPKEINHTNITLILKVKSPKNITEYRPISLCNVVYKLVSKVLANRLRAILLTVVSENQSAFQLRRVITDNILMAFETLHYMKHHQHGKFGYLALKLDMSKAYDRVEQVYLENIMK